MADPLAWLAPAHLIASLAWLAALALLAVRPDSRGAARAQGVAAACLAAGAMPLLDAGGWWIDMPAPRMVPLLAGLALVLALSGAHRLPGRLAALALGGFFIALGLAAARNGTPLHGVLIPKAVLMGVALLLLPGTAAQRPRALLGLALLLAAGVIGRLQDIPTG